MSDLVKRLRDSYDKVSCFPEKMHDGFMRLIELRNIVPEAADKIEQLQRELSEAKCVIVRLHDSRVEFKREINAEKALADEKSDRAYLNGARSGWNAANSEYPDKAMGAIETAYHKARGL